MSWEKDCGLNNEQINNLRNDVNEISGKLETLAAITAEQELTAHLSPASPIPGTILQAHCYLLIVTDLLDELSNRRTSPVKAILHTLNKPNDNQR